MRTGAGAAIAETALAAALWGTSFPVVAWGIQGGLAPTTFVFLRFAAAAPVMLLMAKAMGKRLLPLLKSRAVWAIGFLNAVGFLGQFVGQQYTEASVAALLVNLSVVFAAVGGVVFLGERLGRAKIAGVALALGGAALVTTNGDLASFAGGQALGDMLYMLAAVSWAAYIVYAKRETDRSGWDPVAAASCIIAATAVFVLPPAMVAGGFPRLSSASAAAVAYTAVLNTVVPYILYQRGLKYLSASSSAILLMIQVVVAVVISVAFLHESLTAAGWIGALAVSAAILLASGVEFRSKSLSVAVNQPGRVKDA